jgi:hypothetical protein
MTKKSELLASKIWDMYDTQHMSVKEIAEALGYTRAYIYSIARRNGYSFSRMSIYGSKDPRLRQKRLLEEVCSKFTSQISAAEYLEIPTYSLKVWMNRHGITQDVFIPKIGNKHHRYKTGQWVDKKGYVWISCLPNEYSKINPDWKAPHIRLHKYIAEKYWLGGNPLPKGYCVHHTDENLNNNTVENLAILTISQHKTIHHLIKKIERKIKNGESWKSEKKENWTVEKIDRVERRLRKLLEAWHCGNLVNIRIKRLLSEDYILKVNPNDMDKDFLFIDEPTKLFQKDSQKEEHPKPNIPGYPVYPISIEKV